MTFITIIVFCGGQAGFGQTPSQPGETRPTELRGPSQHVSERIAWTTSNVKGSPEPPLPYRAGLAFPKLKFDRPVTITGAPNTSRLFVVELDGKVFSFPNSSDCDRADLLADLKLAFPNLSQTYGMTFHPDFPRRPFVYICCILNGDEQNGSVIARFNVQAADPPRLDLDSRQIIFRWLAGGHNGCCLKFGPDGYLYISTGDGTGPNPPDVLRAGQDLSNVLSCVLRIDVDRREGDRHYAIPGDNPFIDLAGARPEIWAYGFRNPWKMSFDRQGGALWVGDVGWDSWELVYQVQRGGNYGWSITEGSQLVHPTEKQGPTPILPPVTQHDHSEARSITGGFVYRGQRYPELFGAYVYGDFSTGKVWALWYDGSQVTKRIELTDTPFQIIGWAEADDGELLFMDYDRSNQIYRLVPNEQTDRSSGFPHRLSETGLFSSVADHTPAPGVIPYSINASYWFDGTQAIRLLALPGQSKIGGDLSGDWQFPEGTVVARTVVMDTGHGADEPPRRLETQILHFEDDTWRPYTYVWNDQQDDAELAPAQGMTLRWNQRPSHGGSDEATGQPSLDSASVWHVASRAECKVCHTMGFGAVLGLNVPQANVAIDDHRRRPSHQLTEWYRLGLLRQPPSEELLATDHLVNPYNESEELAQRARSYLHVNCVHCHRPGGGGTSVIHLDATQPLAKTNTIDQVPAQGTFGLPDARIIVPGDPYRSVLFYRLAKSGPGRMPHLGSTTIDEKGLQLIHDWIAKLADSASEPNSIVGVASVIGTDDKPNVSSEIDDQLSTTCGALKLAWHLRFGSLSTEARREVVLAAMKHPQPEVRDLFESFLPPDQQKKRLGVQFDPGQVLDLPGDVVRGRKVYWHTAGLQCQSCHRVHAHGGDLGPDLSEIGKKYEPSALLQTITQPSLKVDPEYQNYVVVTKDGRVEAGRLLANNEYVELKTADNRQMRFPRAEVDRVSPSEKSIMPEQLLQTLSAQEAADLIAYLMSLTNMPPPF